MKFKLTVTVEVANYKLLSRSITELNKHGYKTIDCEPAMIHHVLRKSLKDIGVKIDDFLDEVI